MEPEGSECYNRNHSIQNLEDRKIKTFAANPQADIDIHGFLLCLIELLKSTERPVEEGLANPLLFFANPLTGTLASIKTGHKRLYRKMKKRIYIETTIVTYYPPRPSRDLMIAGHQEATRDLWPELSTTYETYISALVYEEAGRGDLNQAKVRLEAIKPFPMLDIDDEARSLAESIITGKGIPANYPEDALHIAVAAVNNIDVV